MFFSTYFALIAVSQVSTGWLGDRLGYDAVLALLMGLGIVSYVTLVTTTDFLTVVSGVVLVGIAMGFLPPIESRFMAMFSDAERGTGFGLVRKIYLLIGTPGSAVVGTVSDLGEWATAFWLLAMFITGSLLLVVVTWSHRAIRGT